MPANLTHVRPIGRRSPDDQPLGRCLNSRHLEPRYSGHAPPCRSKLMAPATASGTFRSAHFLRLQPPCASRSPTARLLHRALRACVKRMRSHMTVRSVIASGLAASLLVVAAASTASAQAGAETFSATAAVKTAAGATANSPVTVVVSRKMSQAEAEKFLGAFEIGRASCRERVEVSVDGGAVIQGD